MKFFLKNTCKTEKNVVGYLVLLWGTKEAMANKVVTSNLKTVIKKADAAIVSNAADKDAVMKAAVSAIDSAKSKGVIHKNTAARKVSRLAKRANKAAQ